MQGNIAQALAVLDRQPTSVESADANNMTALHFAAKNGHREVVMLLIDRKADLSVVSKACVQLSQTPQRERERERERERSEVPITQHESNPTHWYSSLTHSLVCMSTTTTTTIGRTVWHWRQSNSNTDGQYTSTCTRND
jgi:ankyrin repeat protein